MENVKEVKMGSTNKRKTKPTGKQSGQEWIDQFHQHTAAADNRHRDSLFLYHQHCTQCNQGKPENDVRQEGVIQNFGHVTDGHTPNDEIK